MIMQKLKFCKLRKKQAPFIEVNTTKWKTKWNWHGQSLLITNTIYRFSQKENPVSAKKLKSCQLSGNWKLRGIDFSFSYESNREKIRI